MPYRLIYSDGVKSQLQKLRAVERSAVIRGIEEQLLHVPSQITKNRKKLRPNPLAPFELRIGNLRVYYDVTENDEPSVSIVAIGIKKGSIVFIDDKEYPV
jgi:mRNA-degrading endonuclease RelE of RelBE toxin-antitoxin system